MNACKIDNDTTARKENKNDKSYNMEMGQSQNLLYLDNNKMETKRTEKKNRKINVEIHDENSH